MLPPSAQKNGETAMNLGDGLETRENRTSPDRLAPDRLIFVDPCGEVQAISSACDPVRWPLNLAGLKIGFLSNGKSNVAGFFERFSELLAGLGVSTACRLAKEGPMAEGGEHRYSELQKVCDLAVVGVCDGGTAASQGAVDAMELAGRGIPVVMACTDAFAALARMSLPPNMTGVRLISFPHPLSSLTSEETKALADGAFDDLVSALSGTGGGLSPVADGEAPRSLRDIERDCLVTDPVPDEIAASRVLYDLGFTDGLPAFVPTTRLVDRYLDRRSVPPQPETPVCVPPRGGVAIPQAVAANAAMTGMPPELMPYLTAAVRAACHPDFKLFNLQTTTNPVTPVVVVGGPHRREYGFNDGVGSLGGGNMANATLGRALKLCMRNLGGGRAHDGTDPATMGQPGKYTFCFAENEELTSWPRLREQTSSTLLASADDAVTLVGVTGTMNMIIKSTSADELLAMIAGSIRSIGSNDYMFGGNPLLVLCPEHAEIFEREGTGLTAIRQALFDLTKIPFAEFAPKNQEMMRTPRLKDLGELYPGTEIPLVADPADILVCVTGGASLHSTFMPSFGGSIPVSAKVAVAA